MKVYDKDIRELLIEKICCFKEFHSDPSTVLISEMDICSGVSRVDMAVINGRLHGFEIKSEQDTLDRLPSQIESYNKVFEKMTIIVGENHLEKVLEIVPSWWEVYYVHKQKKGAKLKRKRQGKINKNIDDISLLQLLWKEELINLLKQNGITKGTKSKNRIALGKMVTNCADRACIHDYVKCQLKTRIDWRAVPLQQLYDELLQ